MFYQTKLRYKSLIIVGASEPAMPKIKAPTKPRTFLRKYLICLAGAMLWLKLDPTCMTAVAIHRLQIAYLKCYQSVALHNLLPQQYQLPSFTVFSPPTTTSYTPMTFAYSPSTFLPTLVTPSSSLPITTATTDTTYYVLLYTFTYMLLYSSM